MSISTGTAHSTGISRMKSSEFHLESAGNFRHGA
jgi:hypothetical protein